MGIIDIIILAVIAICIIIGYWKGLTGSLISILGFVLAIVIASILCVPVSNIVMDNTQIDETIKTSIVSIINGEEDEEESKMSTGITDYINQKIEEATAEAKENIVETTADDVTYTIIKAASWIIIFIVAKVALLLLKFISAIITKLPVIKQFDKVGGVIYGLVQGLLLVYFVLALIVLVSPLIDGNLNEKIESSKIGNSMYENNVLINIVF